MKIKQLSRFVLACCLLLTAASCTDEVVTNNGDGGNAPDVPEGMQALTLKVGGISGGSVTKAGVIAKPGEIEVNDMTIYVFKYDPAKGSDDTDDANYTLYDYWTYMKTAITGYTANSRDLHTFTLGGSGQYRTATIYVPKDAGKVKCLVTTGIGLMCTSDGEDSYIITSNNSESRLLSGHTLNTTNTNSPTISAYGYIPYSAEISSFTLEELKKATWRELKSLDLPASSGSEASTILNDYWKTPLSMMGECAMMDIDAQSGNSSQIETTLQRHVSRLDIINGNSLDIRKIELINLPFSTNFVPAVDGMEATTRLTLGGSKASKAEGEPADHYTHQTVYEKAEAMTKAMTAYVYPNLPYNTAETEKNTPFILVTIGADASTTVYTLPLRTKNEDGSYTPVNLKSNHRYTLQLNKLGENFLDYNIVIEEWQAGADFNVNLGDEVTPEKFNYLPALTAVNFDAKTNPSIMDGEKVYCYTSVASSEKSMPKATESATEDKSLKWQFTTENTLGDDTKLNILVSKSQDGIGTSADEKDPTGTSADKYEISASGGTVTHTVSFTNPSTNSIDLYTRWYTIQNPFNPQKSVRRKVEYGFDSSQTGGSIKAMAIGKNQWAFEQTLFSMTETNATGKDQSAGKYTTEEYQADFYYTQWPEKGGVLESNDISYELPNVENLFPSYDATGAPLDTGTGIDLGTGGFKTFKDADGNTYTVASNGNAETPCLIQQTNKAGLKMWERVKGDAGTYYIRILAVPNVSETFNSFEAMRAEIRNVENGYSNYGYIVRYFPEGNYWQYSGVTEMLSLYASPSANTKLFSFEAATFGKLITDATQGYARPQFKSQTILSL